MSKGASSPSMSVPPIPVRQLGGGPCGAMWPALDAAVLLDGSPSQRLVECGGGRLPLGRRADQTGADCGLPIGSSDAGNVQCDRLVAICCPASAARVQAADPKHREVVVGWGVR